jgi:hypothetical protein
MSTCAKKGPADPLSAHRLSAQQISRRALSTPAEVVAWLGAVQAQDPAAARWAVGLRLPKSVATEAALESALAEGSVLRTHVMRWTWQLVCPADVRWLVALVAPRLFARYQRRHQELGLDAATFRKSRTALEKALRDGRHRTRDELSSVLVRAGVPAVGPCLSHLLAHAELEGVICSGAQRGNKATYALLDARAPRARPPLPRDEALAGLALRYFRSRGPATVADFSWWAGLASAEARAGLSAASSQLVSEVVGGQTYWRGEGVPVRASPPSACVLPPFDEYLVAYRDRSAVLAPEHAQRINAGGGLLRPCIVVDGRVVGTWRRSLGPGEVSVELDLFEAVAAPERRAVAAAAERYGEFLGLEVRLPRGFRCTGD